MTTTITVPGPLLNKWRYHVYHCPICGKRTLPIKHRPPGWTSCLTNRYPGRLTNPQPRRQDHYCPTCATRPAYVLRRIIHGQYHYVTATGTNPDPAAAQLITLNQALERAVKIIEMQQTDAVQVLHNDKIIYEKRAE